MLTKIGQRLLGFSALLLIGLLVIVPQQARADAALLQKADKQLAAQKYKMAVRTITKAMNSGSLSDSQMAKALYKRGTAYNGIKRHSAAIADLTGALWLGKLDGASRKRAYQQRALAYKSTGHNKLSQRDLTKSGMRSARGREPSNPPVRAKAATAPPIPTFNTVVRSAKQKKASARTKVAAKPAVKKKAVIPAFRTTIATE